MIVVASAAACAFLLLRPDRNFYAVVEGKVFRSAQPTQHDLTQWAAQYGLKTIISLRNPSYREEAVARRAGLKYIELRCSAEDLPTSHWVRRLIEAVETAPKPLLIHCAAGADRTGAASVIAAMAIGGQTYEQAKGQLSVKYGHIDSDPSHIAGLFVEYEAHCRRNKLPTGGWAEFRVWAVQIYHPAWYCVEISAPAEVSVAPGRKIDMEVTITNRSTRTLPAGDPGRWFYLSAFTGSSELETPDAELGRRVLVLPRDLAPGQSVKAFYTLAAPAQAGAYDVHFDLIEDGRRRTWFAKQGSPVPTFRLIVGQQPPHVGILREVRDLLRDDRDVRAEPPERGHGLEEAVQRPQRAQHALAFLRRHELVVA